MITFWDAKKILKKWNTYCYNKYRHRYSSKKHISKNLTTTGWEPTLVAFTPMTGSWKLCGVTWNAKSGSGVLRPIPSIGSTKMKFNSSLKIGSCPTIFAFSRLTTGSTTREP